MNRAYLVMQGRFYEGSYIRAIFSTQEKAEEYKKKCEALNNDSMISYRVDIWLVDQMT